MAKRDISTAPSEEKLIEAAQRLEEWKKRRKEYEEHEVYYIEDNQEIMFIPGGCKLLRRKCVYDQTTKKLLIIPSLDSENVKRVKDPEVMKKLDELIQHRIRSLNRGIFIRKLYPSGLPDYYCDLLEVMHGYDIPRGIDPETMKEESKWHYQRRKQQYLNMIFDLVISRG